MIKNVHEILLTVGEEVETGRLKLSLEKYEKLCKEAKEPNIEKQLEHVCALIEIVPPYKPFYAQCIKYVTELDIDERDKYREELKEAIFEEIKKYRVVEFV